MNRKLKNTLVLVGLLILILAVGGSYLFIVQRGKIQSSKKKIDELNKTHYNTDQLRAQYQALLNKSSMLDSVLSARKFNIPQNLSSINFFHFVNVVSEKFSPKTQVDVEFDGQKKDKEFMYYMYKIKGSGDFNDLYGLVYAIEQSKELKKIPTVGISNMIATDKDGTPNFLVNFAMDVNVYFSSDNRFSTTKFVENNLNTSPMYDIFYPLIRSQIPPNLDNLLDVQGAKLLALIPEGAFIQDSKGNTFLLWEGQKVYLGYLTKIDYKNNTVSFILNKGGIIDNEVLSLKKDGTSKKN